MAGQVRARSAWRCTQGVALGAACAEGLLLAAFPLLAARLTADPQGCRW